MNTETKDFVLKLLQSKFGDDNIPTTSEDLWKDTSSLMQSTEVLEDLLIALNIIEVKGE
ncbi:hypothetical protein VP14_115 [Vibrio phage VPMCC14]|nr:hypothetical protein VP14_115 [Vibrio phage VPMCC14]